MISDKKLSLIVLCTFLITQIFAQAPKTKHSGEILLGLKKLQVLGSVLYIAAHPDDENTAMLAYLSNDRLYRTGYLSLTRGDGGQNLIGKEQRELMGLIRTQELLQARRIDGAEQFFTRANDFGYSKNAKEAKAIWDEDKVFADVIWVIRNFKPDVIITRFPPNRNAGHGHHEASAMFAIETFKAAADPKRYPEQLKYVQPWQVKRVMWNSYSRRNGRFSNLPPEGMENIQLEIGTYNPLLGKSHGVIAAESRSMHKSQGFGASKPRGERYDNLSLLAGDVPEKELFEEINTTWNRIPNSSKILTPLQKAYQDFSPENPHLIIPHLSAAYQAIDDYPNPEPNISYWLNLKKNEIKDLISACLGLWLEANGTTYSISPGDSLLLNLEAVNRSPLSVTLNAITILDQQNRTLATLDKLPQDLENKKLFRPGLKILVPQNMPLTQPYWLVQQPLKGLFQVNNQKKIGLPENPAALKAHFEIQVEGKTFTYERPVTHKWTKPDEGELYRNLEVTPEVMVNFDENLMIFGTNSPKELKVTLKAGKANVEGTIRPELGVGWKIEPQVFTFNIKQKDAEEIVIFQITPPSSASESELKILLKTKEQSTPSLAKGVHRINYPHIPIQTIFPDAKANLKKLDIQTTGTNIGYIQGAGDDIPRSLRQIGFQVTELKEKDLEEDLSKYDAIVAGVRAYNTQSWLKQDQEKLMEYVKNGGVYVVQYQTSFRLVTQDIGPYPIKLGRSRVSVEEAPIEFLDKNHPILNSPNKITQKDFDNWIQERGLYFAREWDDQYQPVFASNDPGEDVQKGSLLYTNYGEGRFIYTGLSFFRELPAGVTGAYRLFVNLISK